MYCFLDSMIFFRNSSWQKKFQEQKKITIVIIKILKKKKKNISHKIQGKMVSYNIDSIGGLDVRSSCRNSNIFFENVFIFYILFGNNPEK